MVPSLHFQGLHFSEGLNSAPGSLVVAGCIDAKTFVLKGDCESKLFDAS